MLALMLAGTTVLALEVARWYQARITPEMLRAQILHELPVGASSGEVIAFLDARQIGHTGPTFSEFGATGLPRGPATFLYAALRDSRKGEPFADGIFLRFRFDDSDRLTHFHVKYSSSLF